MSKHKKCEHPSRRSLARRRRLMFLSYDLWRLSIVLFVIGVVSLVSLILLEGGI